MKTDAELKTDVTRELAWDIPSTQPPSASGVSTASTSGDRPRLSPTHSTGVNMIDQVLYCRDDVKQPYPRVRALLLADPYLVFRRATDAAASQTAALHVRLGGLDVETEMTIDILGVENDYAYNRPGTKISLEWRDARSPRIFPVMKTALLLFARSPAETQLELRGSYQPSLGKLGGAIDPAAGRRVAESLAAGFLQHVAAWLREQLALSSAAGTVERPASLSEPVIDTEC